MPPTLRRMRPLRLPFSSADRMKIYINYGAEKLSFNLSDSFEFNEIQSVAAHRVVTERDFSHFVENAEKILFPLASVTLFIVNDAYRPTPNETILRWLADSGRLNREAKFLVACGCHQAPTESQLRQIFGALYDDLKKRILIHDADNLFEMEAAGQDRTGETVYLNRAFFENERVGVIGSVEPHYFAGFTGGRKSIFPGICDRATTIRNHDLATSFDAAPMKLEGNPVEEHLRDLMSLLGAKKIFGIQLVLGRGGDITALHCGEIKEAFHEAAQDSEGIFSRKVKSKFDLILAEVLPPLDSNLYQVQKALENCQTAVKDGGTVILFSPCREGIGSDIFFELAERWRPDSAEELEPADRFGIHKLHRVFRIGRRINIYLYSELTRGVPDKVYFRSCTIPQDIINGLAEDSFDIIKTAVVRDAGHTVVTVH